MSNQLFIFFVKIMVGDMKMKITNEKPESEKSFMLMNTSTFAAINSKIDKSHPVERALMIRLATMPSGFSVIKTVMMRDLNCSQGELNKALKYLIDNKFVSYDAENKMLTMNYDFLDEPDYFA